MKRAVAFFLWLALGAVAEDFDLITRSVLVDPAVSRRCRALLERRDDKVEVKNTLVSLLLRNRTLQRRAPERKVTVLKNLKMNEVLVEQKLERAVRRIRYMEEDIIRRGCPRVDITSYKPIFDSPVPENSPPQSGR